jgi:hypothetical protein
LNLTDLNGTNSKDPKNPQAWLDFIRHQNKLLTDDLTGKKRTALLKLINEKKLSIYEKALDALPKNDDLVMGYLECCEQVMECVAYLCFIFQTCTNFCFNRTTKLLSIWDNILTDNPTSYNFWCHYICFRQSNFASFTVPGCLDVFEDCIESMSGASFKKGESRLQRERNLIRILGKLTRFLGQAGELIHSQMKRETQTAEKNRLHGKGRCIVSSHD